MISSEINEENIVWNNTQIKLDKLLLDDNWFVGLGEIVHLFRLWSTQYVSRYTGIEDKDTPNFGEWLRVKWDAWNYSDVKIHKDDIVAFLIKYITYKQENWLWVWEKLVETLNECKEIEKLSSTVDFNIKNSVDSILDIKQIASWEKNWVDQKKLFDALKYNIWEDLLNCIQELTWMSDEIINPSRVNIINFSYPATLNYWFILPPGSLKFYLKRKNITITPELMKYLMKDINYLTIIYCNILYNLIIDFRYNVIREENISESEKPLYEDLKMKLDNIVENHSSIIVWQLFKNEI